ncbi:MAG: thiamine diphosphokinase [Euryarchaeota archaeon]|nr:thiamine diphosphokinase [Euryarchaeota archaeon]
MGGHILVLAAGALPEDGVPPWLLNGPSMVLGCDGGWKHAERLGLELTLILGDLDSVGTPPQGVDCVALPNQHASDLPKVLQWCKEHHPNSSVHVIGLDGGRLDHSVAVPAALIETQSDAVLHMSGGDLRRIPAGHPHNVPAEPGMIIGLHPYGEVHVKRLGGVTWTLEDADLSTGTQGVHNVAVGTEVQIHVASGDLILSRSRHHLA